eukprot:2086490-Karenia_brevis.AAC.1
MTRRQQRDGFRPTKPRNHVLGFAVGELSRRHISLIVVDMVVVDVVVVVVVVIVIIVDHIVANVWSTLSSSL